MRVICSYCRKELYEKEPLDSDELTHTMCDECLIHFRRQWSGMKMDEYLDAFDSPVMLVNEDGRIVASNLRMSGLLEKDQDKLQGLLGGEAMECQFARLPGGCGQTVHCQTCTIRINVMKTMETGEPLPKVQAYLNQPGRKLNLVISTCIKNFSGKEVIEVVVESARAVEA